MADDEPKKILMVDDDVALLRIVREALTTCLRCEVDTSPDPSHGFELALKKSYDLFIFDFSMPMIDGAMLFFLLGKVYDNSHPARIVPPLILIPGKVMKNARRIVEGTRRARPHSKTILHQPVNGKGIPEVLFTGIDVA